MANLINTNTMMGKVISILIALLFVTVLVFPIANSLSNMGKDGGSGGTTVINDGWVGADMEYYTDAPESAQTVTVSMDTENITLSGGYSATYPVSDMILMVSDNQSLAVQNGMMYYNNGVTTVPVDNVTLTLDSSGLNGKPYQWVYFPTEDGLYHSYENGYNALRSDIVSVGSFDGVSVILNNGTVVDSTFDVTATPITQDDKVIGYTMFSVVGTTTPVRGMTDLWGFKIVDGEAVLDKYYGEESFSNTEFVVPSTVTYKGVSYPVVGIVGLYEDGYPEGIIPSYLIESDVTLVLPNTLEFIGDYAFYWDTFVGTLTIPNSVTSIGDYAFSSTEFTSVVFGNSVQTIGDWAFYYCSSLTSMTLPNSLTSIGTRAFEDCSSLTGTLTIPDSLTSIGSNAFNNTGLTYPTAPYTQGDWKFSIKNGGACIWSYEGANFTAYPDSFVVDGVTYPVTQIGNGLNTISEYSLDFPATVTTIGSNAFYKYQYFDNNSVTIPNSVTTIGASAFEQCNLESVTLGSSVVSIGNYAFASNNDLSAIAIPDSVEYIGKHAFSGCQLTSLTLGESVTVIDDYAFYMTEDYHTSKQLIIPDSVEYIGKHAFERGNYEGDLIIPDSVTYIGDYAFENFGGSGVLSLPDSLEYIGDYAFNYSYLTGSLVIPENVTYIGDSAFNENRGFTGSLTIPDSVTYIGKYAFQYYAYDNVGGELTLGNSVSYIGYSAFANTYFANSVIILPDSVTYVSNYALPDRNTTALVNCCSAEFQEDSLDMYGVKTVLNMVENFELNTDSYGLDADTVMNGLTTAGVIQIAEEVPDSGSSDSGGIGDVASTLIKLVPLILVVCLILLFVIPMIQNRTS